jgi:hypothetical protein
MASEFNTGRALAVIRTTNRRAVIEIAFVDKNSRVDEDYAEGEDCVA